ncbi:hypothetical protein B9Z65_374 [Elsinoe australis]|uniref:Uncharacterized protein n=1 Tax=Elsinoe australis TaxID=40998 RepID=A0A2P7ZQE4_9PEZI|nr:hypothetical protein B9Z65_374 [Elsinoe australis]
MARIKRDQPASPEDDTPSSSKRQRTGSPPAHDPDSGLRNGVQPGSLRAVSNRNETFDQVALQLTYAYTDEQIQTNPELRNLNKIKHWLDQALRIKKLDPTNVPAQVDSMRNYLSLPPRLRKSIRLALLYYQDSPDYQLEGCYILLEKSR